MCFQEERNRYLIVVYVMERRRNGIIHGGATINFINLENKLWCRELTSAIKQFIVVSWTSRESPSQILEETVISEQGNTWDQSSCFDKWPSNRTISHFRIFINAQCLVDVHLSSTSCSGTVCNHTFPTNPRRQFPDRTANVTCSLLFWP